MVGRTAATPDAETDISNLLLFRSSKHAANPTESGIPTNCRQIDLIRTSARRGRNQRPPAGYGGVMRLIRPREHMPTRSVGNEKQIIARYRMQHRPHAIQAGRADRGRR